MEQETAARVAWDIKQFGVADAALAQMREAAFEMKIAGVDDLRGFEDCRKARMEVVKFRTRVEKVRKELKADSLEYGRRIDAEAKRLTTLILEIESNLAGKETAIVEERNRIALAAEQALNAKRKQRIESLLQVGVQFNGIGFASIYNRDLQLSQEDLDSLQPGAFEAILQQAGNSKAVAEEAAAAAQRIEQEALQRKRAEEEAERAAFEAQRAKLAQEAEAFRLEREAFERAKREREEAQAAIEEQRARSIAVREQAEARGRAIAAAEAPQDGCIYREPVEAPAEAVQPAPVAPACFHGNEAETPAEAPAAAQEGAEQVHSAQGWFEAYCVCPACDRRFEIENWSLQTKLQTESCPFCAAKVSVRFG